MMIWKKMLFFLKSIWRKITSGKTSLNNTTFDTVSLKLFGLDIKLTRELPVNMPYELTVVVPRAELRFNKDSGNLEIILNSITIAHSPRPQNETDRKPPVLPKPVVA